MYERTNRCKTTEMRITYLDVTSVERGFEPPFLQMSSMEIKPLWTKPSANLHWSTFVWYQSDWSSEDYLLATWNLQEHPLLWYTDNNCTCSPLKTASGAAGMKKLKVLQTCHELTILHLQTLRHPMLLLVVLHLRPFSGWCKAGKGEGEKKKQNGHADWYATEDDGDAWTLCSSLQPPPSCVGNPLRESLWFAGLKAIS